MKNIDKIKKLNTDSLAFILMCPNEFDNNFNKNEREDEFCHKKGKGCTECIKKWLDEDYRNGFDYLKENETERKLEYNNYLGRWM
ncbi:hypothetical protein ACTNDG_09835 [Clostridium sp. HCP1S3_B4]|uniref:hypothetical protein n=1 Tax=unclassified Clostridium TaxID=2614128 RepID=UPI003F8C22D4